MSHQNPIRSQQGIIGLLGVLLFSAVILVIGSGMIASSAISYKISSDRLKSTQNLYNAESGAEDALMHIRRDPTFGASGTTINTVFDTRNRVDTDIETGSVSGCNPARIITASGYAGDKVRRIQLNDCAVPSANAQFAYALQSGDGGISMGNNAVINGSSYTNGNHVGSPGANVTGDVYAAGAPAATPTPQHDPASVTDYVFANISSKVDVAQSFTADTTSSDKLVRVSMKVRKFGAPSDATIRIVTDNANKPSNTQVGGGTLAASTVGSTAAFVDVSLSTPATLTSGQRYWIVFDAPSSNAANYWAWASDNSFAGGSSKYSPQWRNGGSMTWTDTNTDFAFKAFMGAPPTYVQGLNIGGDVHANTIINNSVTRDAYFQVNNGSTIGGASYPNSPDPAAQDLPISDSNIADFRAQAGVGTVYNGNYTVPADTTQTLGPLRVNGDFYVGIGAKVIMYGTIYVTGSVIFDNNTTLQLDPGYGSGSGTLLADGSVTLLNNMTVVTAAPGSFILAVSTKPSGTAVSVNNNASGLVLVSTKATLSVSNNAVANALAAYRLELANNSVINYVTGLANVNFSAGPGASFQAKGWKEVILD